MCHALTLNPHMRMAAQVLRALALSTSKLGDLAYRGGDLSTARARYCDALAARRRAFTDALAELSPEPSALDLGRLLPPTPAGFPSYPYCPAVSGDGSAPCRKAAGGGAAAPAGVSGAADAGLGAAAVPLALDLATSLCKLADLDKVGRALRQHFAPPNRTLGLYPVVGAGKQDFSAKHGCARPQCCWPLQ